MLWRRKALIEMDRRHQPSISIIDRDFRSVKWTARTMDRLLVLRIPEWPVRAMGTLYETGKNYGLKIEQFIFDVLTFTLATGEDEFLDAGKNTLEGIKHVKAKFPNCFTTLGLSNISFGLMPYARKILNSVKK